MLANACFERYYNQDRLAVDDFSRVGALSFQDESGVFQRGGGRGKRTAPPLIELDSLLRATRAVETETETAADLEYLRGRGTIGKFPSVHDSYSVTKGEVLALRIAAAAGIRAADARIVESDGTPIALIKRFDRGPHGERIPYLSAATLLGIEDSHRVHTYTEIVDALNRYSPDYRTDKIDLLLFFNDFYGKEKEGRAGVKRMSYS